MNREELEVEREERVREEARASCCCNAASASNNTHATVGHQQCDHTDRPLLSSSSSSPPPPSSPILVLYLDHIIDPVNIGGILRTAYFYGVDHVILGPHCAPCSAASARSSTGLMEWMQVYRSVVPTVQFVREAVAASSSSSSSCWTWPDGEPISLEVIGTTTLIKKTEKKKNSEASNDFRGSAAFGLAHRGQPREENNTNKNTNNDNIDDDAPTAVTASCRYCLRKNQKKRKIRLVLLGNERDGLSGDVLQHCTHFLHLPSPRVWGLQNNNSAMGLQYETNLDLDDDSVSRTAPSQGKPARMEACFTPIRLVRNPHCGSSKVGPLTSTQRLSHATTTDAGELEETEEKEKAAVEMNPSNASRDDDDVDSHAAVNNTRSSTTIMTVEPPLNGANGDQSIIIDKGSTSTNTNSNTTTATAAAAGTTAFSREKMKHAARLRENEVSLNVHAACAALLSHLVYLE